jgi:hypothetical protein
MPIVSTPRFKLRCWKFDANVRMLVIDRYPKALLGVTFGCAALIFLPPSYDCQGTAWINKVLLCLWGVLYAWVSWQVRACEDVWGVKQELHRLSLLMLLVYGTELIVTMMGRGGSKAYVTWCLCGEIVAMLTVGCLIPLRGSYEYERAQRKLQEQSAQIFGTMRMGDMTKQQNDVVHERVSFLNSARESTTTSLSVSASDVASAQTSSHSAWSPRDGRHFRSKILKLLLADAEFQQAFGECLAREYSVETLLFYKAVCDYKKTYFR